MDDLQHSPAMLIICALQLLFQLPKQTSTVNFFMSCLEVEVNVELRCCIYKIIHLIFSSLKSFLLLNSNFGEISSILFLDLNNLRNQHN